MRKGFWDRQGTHTVRHYKKKYRGNLFRRPKSDFSGERSTLFLDTDLSEINLGNFYTWQMWLSVWIPVKCEIKFPDWLQCYLTSHHGHEILAVRFRYTRGNNSIVVTSLHSSMIEIRHVSNVIWIAEITWDKSQSVHTYVNVTGKALWGDFLQWYHFKTMMRCNPYT